uniref:Uncharacterized protein n=1 Tax=Callorhinchus milii TaxID=7868 RepID=A0A4W3HSX2_CALMI
MSWSIIPQIKLVIYFMAVCGTLLCTTFAATFVYIFKRSRLPSRKSSICISISKKRSETLSCVKGAT